MTQVKPFIKCVDFWPDGIPPDRLAIYKQFIEEGQILKHHVLVNRRTHATTVEYYAIAPHEWIRHEMARRLSERRDNND
ncbi:MAG: hypothetical protein IKG23_00525 [Clostridia bacterium]|nr:hypothetical protein [Clostridia bacterium]